FSRLCTLSVCRFFFNATATTEIYTLSLHDALPILSSWDGLTGAYPSRLFILPLGQVVDEYTKLELRSLSSIPLRLSRSEEQDLLDRKSTRLNSSHVKISYAVFCLKKKKSEI